MSLIEAQRDYYKGNFRIMKKGYTWPLHFVYDKADFINGRAPAFAWDELDEYHMAIYSLTQNYDMKIG